MTQPEHAWTPELLIRFPLLTEVDLSPDGEQIVYAVREPVLTEEESKFVTHLYRVGVNGGEPLRLTYGPYANSLPRWSPDGQYIAFLSTRTDNKANVWVLRAAGGEAWPLTKAEKGVQSFIWSPDGTRLALTMVAPDTEDKKKAKKAKDDTLRWDIDHERAQLWVIPFAPGGDPLPEPRALTPADRHVTSVDWTDDSSALAFTYQPTPVDDEWPQTRLAVVTANNEAAIRELALVAAWHPVLKARGDVVACIVSEPPVRWSVANRILLYPLAGGEPRPLALTEEAQPFPIGWSRDGQAVYIIEVSRTSSAIRALPVDGSAPVTLVDGQGFLAGPRMNKHDRIAFVAQDLDKPNYIAVMDTGDTAWREVLPPALPADWPTECLPETRILQWRADDGLEIEGIVALPLGYEPGKAYPLLIVVHGGPTGVFSRTYVGGPGLYSTAAFAERGYAVLQVNPRGSGGYGPAFREANLRDWGGGDYRDIMAGVETLIAQGIADPARLGIMGWSYGGYMTSWAITQTHRFKAASVGAGVTNLMSFNGTSDIVSFLPYYMDAEFWDDLEVYRQHSAMFQVQGVTTPTLIQHGAEDIRVPLSQGRELYNALKRQGVTVEMDIYPRQGHGPSEPRIIVDIVRRNLAWFDRWIKG